MSKNYILKTERLGLRNWTDDDIIPFNAMCRDKEVMRYFPKLATLEETRGLITRLKAQFTENGYTYFAIDILDTGEFIGFTGFAWQTWDSDYTPNADIGWRLKRSAWGQGYATEAARACLENALEKFGLKTIISVASQNNEASIHVMKKLGMRFVGTINHPSLIETPHLNPCVIYQWEDKS